jgi:YD repeat-containing protein
MQDVWPFIQGGTNYTMKFDYDASGNMIYTGWAQTGSATSDAAWRIMQQTFNGSNQLTDVKWPNGSTAFNAIWDSRASAYTYK